MAESQTTLTDVDPVHKGTPGYGSRAFAERKAQLDAERGEKFARQQQEREAQQFRRYERS